MGYASFLTPQSSSRWNSPFMVEITSWILAERALSSTSPRSGWTMIIVSYILIVLFLLTVIEPRSNPEQGDTAEIAALLETGIITTVCFNYQGFLGSLFRQPSRNVNFSQGQGDRGMTRRRGSATSHKESRRSTQRLRKSGVSSKR